MVCPASLLSVRLLTSACAKLSTSITLAASPGSLFKATVYQWMRDVYTQITAPPNSVWVMMFGGQLHSEVGFEGVRTNPPFSQDHRRNASLRIITMNVLASGVATPSRSFIYRRRRSCDRDRSHSARSALASPHSTVCDHEIVGEGVATLGYIHLVNARHPIFLRQKESPYSGR